MRKTSTATARLPKRLDFRIGTTTSPEAVNDLEDKALVEPRVSSAVRDQGVRHRLGDAVSPAEAGGLRIIGPVEEFVQALAMRRPGLRRHERLRFGSKRGRAC